MAQSPAWKMLAVTFFNQRGHFQSFILGAKITQESLSEAASDTARPGHITQGNHLQPGWQAPEHSRGEHSFPYRAPFCYHQPWRAGGSGRCGCSQQLSAAIPRLWLQPAQPCGFPCACAAALLEAEVCPQPHCASGRERKPSAPQRGLQAAVCPAPGVQCWQPC